MLKEIKYIYIYINFYQYGIYYNGTSFILDVYDWLLYKWDDTKIFNLPVIIEHSIQFESDIAKYVNLNKKKY